MNKKAPLNFTEYQIRARGTDQNPEVSVGSEASLTEPKKHDVIPFLGLVGEVGGLLSEYKKMLRDGPKHEQFPDQVAEELGDILWYVATVATKFGLDLNKIAEDNLLKTIDRWHKPDGKRPLYDDSCEINQQFPRRFSYKFSHEKVGEIQKLVLTDTLTGNTVGDPLTDNAYEDDGYRYHDVLHLAFVAHFGWSPVFRKLLRKGDNPKIISRTPPTIADAEDGGRAQVIDEAIVAAAYIYAENHAFLKGVKVVDWQLLRHIQGMTANLEVRDRTTWEWNQALLDGFKIWRQLREHKGGIVSGDLLSGTLSFSQST